MADFSKPAKQDPALIAAMIAAALQHQGLAPERVTQRRNPIKQPESTGFWDRIKQAWK